MKKLTAIIVLLCLCREAAAVTTWYASSNGTLSAASSAVWSGNLANSCSNLQTACNSLSAGDTLYCAGTFLTSTTLSQSNAGASGNYIRVIGCNSSGANDGTSRCSILS